MLTRDNVVLCVIDFQDGLLPKIPVAEALLDQAVKLIRFARELDLPIVWTEQYSKGLGPTNEKIAGELKGLKPFEKVSFGCFGAAGFAETLAATARRQILVTGIETHVCVMQTVLSALALGYEAFVPNDAAASRNKADHKAGLARMRDHGAEIVTMEMAMFEILRVAGTPEFKKVLPLIK
jgi:nicotinamidase-related amidase